MFALQEPLRQTRSESLTDEEAVLTTLPPDAFRSILNSHRREGYDAGYRRAISDILAASVFVAEKSLLTARDPADGRQVIYRFIQLLESETLRNSQSNEMSGGLGI